MQLKYPKSLQSGIGLIDSDDGRVILAIGLPGVASMQAMTLKGTQSSHERTVALIAAYSLLDAMRSHRLTAMSWRL